MYSSPHEEEEEATLTAVADAAAGLIHAKVLHMSTSHAAVDSATAADLADSAASTVSIAAREALAAAVAKLNLLSPADLDVDAVAAVTSSAGAATPASSDDSSPPPPLAADSKIVATNGIATHAGIDNGAKVSDPSSTPTTLTNNGRATPPPPPADSIPPQAATPATRSDQNNSGEVISHTINGARLSYAQLFRRHDAAVTNNCNHHVAGHHAADQDTTTNVFSDGDYPKLPKRVYIPAPKPAPTPAKSQQQAPPPPAPEKTPPPAPAAAPTMGGPKTVLCDNWRERGRCPFGDKCKNAHGEKDQVIVPGRKGSGGTRPCVDFYKKRCRFGVNCLYPHPM